MKKLVTSVIAIALVTASVAFAAGPGPFYARGGYYDAGWSADAGNLMTLSAGVWTVAATSPMAAGYYEGKVAAGDWSESYPNSNQPVFITGPGDIVAWTFDTNVYADGWLPATDIAYNDHMIGPGHTFEVIGLAPETGGWASGIAAVLAGDVWSVQLNIATPGSYDWKFRDERLEHQRRGRRLRHEQQQRELHDDAAERAGPVRVQPGDGPRARAGRRPADPDAAGHLGPAEVAVPLVPDRPRRTAGGSPRNRPLRIAPRPSGQPFTPPRVRPETR